MTKRNATATPTVLTIGHSTRPLDEFINILRAYGVAEVVDVRTVPRSRHNPQFNRDTLPDALSAVGIGYSHIPELGGLRRPSPDSRNTAWRNESFRGYADYMQTSEFMAGLEELMQLASHKQVTIMCAEAVPWRCHRSLIGDALLVRGFQVRDIMSETKEQAHALTPWAEVQGTQLSYPASVAEG